MHGWSKHIRIEAKKKFADFFVCLRTYVSQFFFKVPLCPAQQPPVFVVDEYSAIFYRWRCRIIRIHRQINGITMFNRSIHPPIPRAHPYRPAEGQQAVCSPPTITSDHDKSPSDALERSFHKPDGIAFPISGNGRDIYFTIPDKSVNQGAVPESPGDDGITARCGNRAVSADGRHSAGHFLYVRSQQSDSCTDDRGF